MPPIVSCILLVVLLVQCGSLGLPTASAAFLVGSQNIRVNKHQHPALLLHDATPSAAFRFYKTIHRHHQSQQGVGVIQKLQSSVFSATAAAAAASSSQVLAAKEPALKSTVFSVASNVDPNGSSNPSKLERNYNHCNEECDYNSNPRSSFGTKDYWDALYSGYGDFPAAEYSWYCDWTGLKRMLKSSSGTSGSSSIHRNTISQVDNNSCLPRPTDRILLPGIGNDPLLAELLGAGYQSLTAQDYSAPALDRQRDLLSHFYEKCDNENTNDSVETEDEQHGGRSRSMVLQQLPPIYKNGVQQQVCLSCCNVQRLPAEWDESFDVILEKGLLDAVYLSTSDEDDCNMEIRNAVFSLAATLKPGGLFISVSGVVPHELRRHALFPLAQQQPDTKQAATISSTRTTTCSLNETANDTGATTSADSKDSLTLLEEQTWKWLRDGSNDLKAGCFVFKKSLRPTR